MSLTNDTIQITATNAALEQIKLIKENDFTLEGMVFRLKIGGKGCDGFTYEMGFTPLEQDDIVYSLSTDIDLHLDPFSAYYCQKGEIDYLFVVDSDEEGLIFQNDNEHLFNGKFFKDESLLPPKSLTFPS